MVGTHFLTRMAAKTRLVLLFSTVLVLFFARISLADEPDPPRAHVSSVAFEDFMEFQSLAGAEIQREKGPGCSARASESVRPSINPVLPGRPTPPSQVPSQAEGTIVLGSTGYNYQRHR